MSATLTPYGRSLLLNAVFRPDVYSAPTGLWLVYTRAIPVPGSDGTQLDEASGLARTALGALRIRSGKFCRVQRRARSLPASRDSPFQPAEHNSCLSLRESFVPAWDPGHRIEVRER